MLRSTLIRQVHRMIKGMTGFGAATGNVKPWGRLTLEIRSINHRFLDIVLHLPGGFSRLEDELKQEITKRLVRGRVTCTLNINGGATQKASLNKALLRRYFLELQKVKRELRLREEININNLMHLPGVWTVEEVQAGNESAAAIKLLLKKALDELVRCRQKEGQQMHRDLIGRLRRTREILSQIHARYAQVLRHRVAQIASPEEQNAFLKDADITEELVRLRFHLKSAMARLNSSGAVGKELDFIAQEMQREINTVGAKSIDAAVSGKVVQIKSEIEKIREQLQNIE